MTVLLDTLIFYYNCSLSKKVVEMGLNILKMY